jgi:hypothetical protein
VHIVRGAVTSKHDLVGALDESGATTIVATVSSYPNGSGERKEMQSFIQLSLQLLRNAKLE